LIKFHKQYPSLLEDVGAIGSDESIFTPDSSYFDTVISYFSSICCSSVGSAFAGELLLTVGYVRKPVDVTPRTGCPAPRVR